MPSSSEDRSILARAASAPTSSMSYGPHRDQVIDEWLPPTSGEVTVMLLHGGFWDQEYDRSHCRPLAAALAARGVRVLLPEYRRVRGAGGWPATFDDVQAAGQGMSMTSTGRLVLVGHSAGGQLALWLAAAHPPAGLAAVLALAPVADLAGAARLRLGDGAVERLMGGSPATEPERYAAVDPMRLPATQVPVAIMHGSADSVVPLVMSRSYAHAHPQVKLLVHSSGHFELIDPLSEHFGALLEFVLGK